jgi:hypothetical protein
VKCGPAYLRNARYITRA